MVTNGAERNMKKEFKVISGNDKFEIHGVLWEAKEPSAVMIIVHGFGEHSGRYENMAKHIIKNNISFYDAPVSGGEVGAINGVLSIMIGGPNNKIPFLKKIMSTYSKSIVHIGPSGHGQLTKMVNQLCIAGLIQALSEGISLGQSAGLNMNKVLEAISNGAAQSWQMDNRFKTMIKEEFDFGFAVSLMIKDLKIALNEAQDKNLDLQISNIILQNYKKLLELGDGTLDTSSLIKLIKT